MMAEQATLQARTARDVILVSPLLFSTVSISVAKKDDDFYGQPLTTFSRDNDNVFQYPKMLTPNAPANSGALSPLLVKSGP